MITFRKINYEKDIPNIIALVKLGLSDKNTVESFFWKHQENPFGKSLGLLAWDEEELIGVRMFMFWEFRRKSEIRKAIRPVDTIIHPKYRGKGLFKKLTLEGLRLWNKNYELIYNTPNRNSCPGYIKMGWTNFEDKLEFKAAFVLPSIMNYHLDIEISQVKLINVNILMVDYSFFRTNLTNEYLHWRYKDPVYRVVNILSGEKMGVIIYRIEKLKGFKTLIINEIFGEFPNQTLAIKKLLSLENTYFVYYLENNFSKFNFVFSKRKHTAVIVYREDQFNIMNNIALSSGDLEGRL